MTKIDQIFADLRIKYANGTLTEEAIFLAQEEANDIVKPVLERVQKIIDGQIAFGKIITKAASEINSLI